VDRPVPERVAFADADPHPAPFRLASERPFEMVALGYLALAQPQVEVRLTAHLRASVPSLTAPTHFWEGAELRSGRCSLAAAFSTARKVGDESL
jgi:hypothetical protein